MLNWLCVSMDIALQQGERPVSHGSQSKLDTIWQSGLRWCWLRAGLSGHSCCLSQCDKILYRWQSLLTGLRPSAPWPGKHIHGQFSGLDSLRQISP